MAWAEHHSRSEHLAAQASAELRKGEQDMARKLYREAAAAEMAALKAVDSTKKRTLGVTAVSAVALFFKGQAYEEAEKFGYRSLADYELPAFAQQQLRELLQDIWAERAREGSSVKFVPGDVLVSVKGGPILHGGAPLDLIVEKVSQVEKLLYRTAEFLLQRPHRKRGEPDAEVKSMVRPWLIQAPAGSYQFAVRVQEPFQRQLFADERPKIEQVSRMFLQVLRIGATNPDALKDIVPDEEYRDTFLKMTRNLAPTGKSFQTIDFKETGEAPGHTIALSPAARSEINAHIRARRGPSVPDAAHTEVRGVLRALHLDEQWLEVTVDDPPGRHMRVRRTTEALDDIIGPMVNHRVVVEVVRRGTTLVFRDIELEE